MKEVDGKNLTQRIMTVKWIFLLSVYYEAIVITSPSIAGVTYMDQFDFEERYRDANECNPFYWHPLHLPAYCADIFEKLIRSRLASKTPIRIARKREKIKNLEYAAGISHDTQSDKYTHTKYTYPYPEELYQFPYPVYQITSAEYESYSPPYTKPLPMSPYERIIKLLKAEIKKDPSSPTVTVMPDLGPVALYKQAISKKSENMIRHMAEAYVEATKKMYDEYYKAYGNYPSEPQLFVYDSAKNKTNAEKNKKKDKKKKDKKDKNKVYRMKTKHGGVVTIIETKNLEMMKNDPSSFML